MNSNLIWILYRSDSKSAYIETLNCKKIIEGLNSNQLEVITPTAPHKIAGNAAFAFNEPEHFVKRAAEDGILVWGDNNRVRISAHVFTTANDVDVFLGNLPKYLS